MPRKYSGEVLNNNSNSKINVKSNIFLHYKLSLRAKNCDYAIST